MRRLSFSMQSAGRGSRRSQWRPRIRAAGLSLQYGLLAVEEDIAERLLALGFSGELTQAVLYGDRRLLGEDVGSRPKAA
jgi:hypothetical protein